jgi:UDP:flavonoid glycosyltransferase YjiC (YdhE family)
VRPETDSGRAGRSRVLVACSLGGAGHLGPLLPFIGSLTEAGHEVVLVGPPSMADQVERTGGRFWPGGEPPEEQIAPIRELLPLVPAAEATVLGNRDLFGRLAADSMLPAMADAFGRWRPDLVLRDPCEYASAVVAYQRGVSTATVAISLADAEWGSITAASPALEAHAAGLTDWLRNRPYLSRFPSSLDPSPFPMTLRYRHDDDGRSRSLPSSWWPSADGPLLYVTFGTVLGYMSHAERVYRAVLDAIDGLPVRALFTVGRRFDPTPLHPIPKNVHIDAWIDQADILDQVDLVVCHGGSGTVLGALAASVPMVIVPVFADQFANAQRIVACGAGVAVTASTGGGQRRPVAANEVPRIRGAIEGVLASRSRFGGAARRIRDEISNTPPVENVLAGLLDPDGSVPEGST